MKSKQLLLLLTLLLTGSVGCDEQPAATPSYMGKTLTDDSVAIKQPAATLPYIGKPLPDDSVDINRLTMTSPSQVRPTYRSSDETFLLAPDEAGLVAYVTPDPGNSSFSTPDGASRASTYEDIRRIGGAKALRVPGWAYTARLPSGWVAAFCVGESCTDGVLSDSETVSFLYLDSVSEAGGEP